MNKHHREILKNHRIALEKSSKTFQDIYNIMFRSDVADDILCESNDGYRIQKYTFGQVAVLIEQTAAALYKQYGATHRYIALEMENGLEWIVAFWAILRSGNKPFLVNCRHTKALSDSLLKTLQIDTVLCKENTLLDARALVFDSLKSTDALPDDVVFEDEIAFSSSATSMNEVIVFYTGKQIAAQILNFKSILKECPRMAKHYKGSIKQLAFLPFYHVFGLFAVYFWFTFFGKTLVFLRDYSADTILSTCRRHEVTHIFAVPMLWHTIEKKVLDTVRKKGEKKQKAFEKGLRICTALQNVHFGLGSFLAKRIMKEVTSALFGNSVMFCISGGSYLKSSAAYLMNGIGYSMHNGYGASEIGITSVELQNKPKYANLVSIGHPFDAVEYQLDEEGILLVKGDTLCTKKWINGEELLTDEWYYTGDYASVKDGQYSISGRKSDVVIGENGENINPDMIEQHFSLSDALSYIVLGLGDQTQEELSMIVQISPYLNQTRLTAMVDDIYQINATLPLAMQVRKFFFTKDNLAPPTAVKVGRKFVKRGLSDGTIHLTPFSEIDMHAENLDSNPALLLAVRRIIAEELGLDIEDVKENAHIMLDLGGTSIHYFSILAALSKEFDIQSDSDVDKYRYTPLEIAEYIERYI